MWPVAVNKLMVNAEGGLSILRDMLDDHRLNEFSENRALIDAIFNLATEGTNCTKLNQCRYTHFIPQ